eukprot:978390-Prorocentrum_minimum.AAC.2
MTLSIALGSHCSDAQHVPSVRSDDRVVVREAGELISTSLGSSVGSTDRSAHGLHDVLIQDVGHGALAHVDAVVQAPLGVQVVELRHNLDRVQPGVLRQRVRDHLKPTRNQQTNKRHYKGGIKEASKVQT